MLRPSLVARTAVAAALLVAPRGAAADGAFPDSLGIFLPADRPDEILAATNFGLLLSVDAGASWDWVCEEAIGPYAAPYQLGPSPENRIIAVHYQGLSVSSDRGCSWTAATGPFDIVNDAFPDPSDPEHVLVIGNAAPAEGEPSLGAMLASTDGGATFGAPSFFAPPGAYLSGVEISRSDPGIIYLAMYGDPPGHAALVRSEDGGDWEAFDLTPSLGAPVARIIAVHPEDPDLLYLRLQDGDGSDELAIYHHDTQEGRIALQLDFVMTAFLLRSDGALIVGAGDGSAFISEDEGDSFHPWEGAPRLRALGERDGKLYAVADNFQDGFAVGVSSNLGETWEPLLRFDQIRGPLACGEIPAICAVPWANLKVLFGIDPGPDDPDAGPVTEDDGDGGGTCGCRVGGRLDAPWGALAFVLVGPFLAARRRRDARRPIVSGCV